MTKEKGIGLFMSPDGSLMTVEDGKMVPFKGEDVVLPTLSPEELFEESFLEMAAKKSKAFAALRDEKKGKSKDFWDED